MAKFCDACGQPLGASAKFCKGCGKAVAGSHDMAGRVRQAAGLLAQSTAAPAASGEMTIALPKAAAVLKPLLTTGQILSGGIGGYFKTWEKPLQSPSGGFRRCCWQWFGSCCLTWVAMNPPTR